MSTARTLQQKIMSLPKGVRTLASNLAIDAESRLNLPQEITLNTLKKRYEDKINERIHKADPEFLKNIELLTKYDANADKRVPLNDVDKLKAKENKLTAGQLGYIKGDLKKFVTQKGTELKEIIQRSKAERTFELPNYNEYRENDRFKGTHNSMWRALNKERETAYKQLLAHEPKTNYKNTSDFQDADYRMLMNYKIAEKKIIDRASASHFTKLEKLDNSQYSFFNFVKPTLFTEIKNELQKDTEQPAPSATKEQEEHYNYIRKAQQLIAKSDPSLKPILPKAADVKTLEATAKILSSYLRKETKATEHDLRGLLAQLEDRLGHIEDFSVSRKKLRKIAEESKPLFRKKEGKDLTAILDTIIKQVDKRAIYEITKDKKETFASRVGGSVSRRSRSGGSNSWVSNVSRNTQRQKPLTQSQQDRRTGALWSAGMVAAGWVGSRMAPADGTVTQQTTDDNGNVTTVSRQEASAQKVTFRIVATVGLLGLADIALNQGKSIGYLAKILRGGDGNEGRDNPPSYSPVGR